LTESSPNFPVQFSRLAAGHKHAWLFCEFKGVSKNQSRCFRLKTDSNSNCQVPEIVDSVYSAFGRSGVR